VLHTKYLCQILKTHLLASITSFILGKRGITSLDLGFSTSPSPSPSPSPSRTQIEIEIEIIEIKNRKFKQIALSFRLVTKPMATSFPFTRRIKSAATAATNASLHSVVLSLAAFSARPLFLLRSSAKSNSARRRLHE
jgi:hypothetical protein